MSYLIRLQQGKTHDIAHYIHEIDGVSGALCSRKPKPAVGDQTHNGIWLTVDELPPAVQICRTCQRIQHKLDNPLPERVERELEKLARWDPRAADRQREKMMAIYRQKLIPSKRLPETRRQI
ncbi:MAG: hypothetical protein KBE23_11625 [Chloroflexi bacterium]|nr:hypothetical protein [Chloroflexota bacterium]MBP7043384.1 hypothetical protein [Chloroflexota bacterium]